MLDKIFKVLLIALLSFIAYTLHTQTTNARYSYSFLDNTVVDKKTGNLYMPAKKEYNTLSQNTRNLLNGLLELMEKSEDSQ